MRILYYFPERNAPMQQWQRIHIFDELNHHGINIDSFNPLKYESMEMVHDELMKRVKNGHYDLFFTDCCNPRKIKKETLREVKRFGLPTLSIRFDNLVIPYDDKELSSEFDLLWLTAKETKYFYDKWNAKTFFAPYAANPFKFVYNKSDIKNRHVCFIGTPYGSRSIMINCLTDNHIHTDVYYKKDNSAIKPEIDDGLKMQIESYGKIKLLYNRLLFPQGRKLILGKIVNLIHGQNQILENDYIHSFQVVKPDEQSALYSQYVIALASTSTNHTDVLKSPLKIINLRNFEIPMSGGIELCKYNPELAEYFEDGKEILFYHCNEELIDKARFYSERAKDRDIISMKLAARKRAELEHTWWNRFCIAFDYLGLK